MRSRWFTIIASLALLAVAGAGVYFYQRNAAAQQKAAPEPPPQVYTGPDVTLQGKTRAITVTAIAAPIEGRVESFLVEVGDEVHEGQLLAQISSESLNVAREHAAEDLERAQTRVNNLESALISARLEASRAEADEARARGEAERTEKIFQRQKLLYAEGATPRLTFEKAEREYKAARTEFEGLETLAKNAQSRVDQLQKDVDAAKSALEEKQKDFEDAQAAVTAGEVHAPASGVVVARRGVVGDTVDRSMGDLFQLATDLSRMEVVLEPPPPVLARIRTGQNAAVQIAENAGDPMAGTVRRVDKGMVIVEFANPNPLVKPGMTAGVRILLDSIK